MIRKRPPLVTALKQRKPMPKVRDKRRRDEGRVQHGRIKEKHTEPNAAQKRYWGSLIPQCVVCGAEAVPHHILADCPGKEFRRDHWFVVMLCPLHHNMGTDSVHLLGSEEMFLKVHAIDLVWIATRNLASWRAAA